MTQSSFDNTNELIKKIEKLQTHIDSLNRKNSDFLGHYHQLLAKEKTIAFVWFIDKNNIQWSKDAEITLGLNNINLGSTKESFLQCIKQEDIFILESTLSNCFKKLLPHCDFNFRLNEINSEEIWVKAICEIQYNDFGNPIEIRGLVKDITPLKTTEQEQYLNNLRYQILFNYSPVPLWEEEFSELFQYINNLKISGVTDFDNYFNEHPEALILCSQKIKITDVNLATLKLHNAKSKEELTGNLDKIFTEKSYEVFKNEIIALANGECEFETEGEIKTLQGEAKQIYLKLIVNYSSSENNNAKAMLATIDITDKKKADAALAESEKRFRASFEDSDVAMCIVGTNQKFLAVNKAFCKMLEFDFENISDKTFIDITHPEDIDESIDKYSKSLQNKEAFTIEKRYLTKSGKIRWGLTSVSPIFNTKGEFINNIVHIQDITNRKKSEEELIKSNKEYEILTKEYKAQNEELINAIAIAERSDQLKSEFLQNLSHEIRTPMNAILGFTEFLESDNINPAKRTQYINIIKNSGYQLLRVIDDILEISALETKHIQVIESEFCINDLLTELFTIFQPQAKKQNLSLYLHKTLTDDCCIIKSDELKLKKILMNLVENSLKYTNSGFIELGYHYTNNKIQLYVKDTGIGIKPERHNQIFERFSQAEGDISKKIGGLGLGLSIVKENVKLLNGEIKLISDLDKGSEFIVSLPGSLLKKTIDQMQECNSKKEFNILIAEDEEINYFYFKSLMEEIAPNCSLEHAKNGKEAIAFCQEKSYDLIFMDIKMPEVNGYQATIEIMKLNPLQKIIAQTAYSTEEDKTKARLAGCIGFISKPIRFTTVQEILDQYLFSKTGY